MASITYHTAEITFGPQKGLWMVKVASGSTGQYVEYGPMMKRTVETFLKAKRQQVHRQMSEAGGIKIFEN